ncbi:hypothetical protein EV122DRAFT_226375, partial [Schizophyllum commune]
AQNYDGCLQQPADFAPFGLLYNPIENIAICVTCDAIVSVLSKHLASSKKHSVSRSTPDRVQVEACQAKMDELGISPDGPSDRPSQNCRPLIAGLSFSRVYYCTACTFVRTERHHVTRHVNTKPCCSRAAVAPDTILAQRYCKNDVYLRVAPPPSTTNAIFDAFRRFQQARAANKPVAPDDARLVSPLLIRTLWHTHTELIDVEVLLAAAGYPKDAEFPGLFDLVHEYFAYCASLLRDTDHLVRQHINTSEPPKCVSFSLSFFNRRVLTFALQRYQP